MKRRNFISTAILGLPISATLLQSAIASAGDDSGWTPAGPGIQKKSLFLQGTAEAALFRLKNGAVVPAHTHPAGEYSFMADGTFSLGGQTAVKGAYFYMPPGSNHPSGSAGPTGALIFVFTPQPVIFS